MVFPNGSIDPWHALGIVKDLSPDATAIFIQGKGIDKFITNPVELNTNPRLKLNGLKLENKLIFINRCGGSHFVPPVDKLSETSLYV